MEINEINHLYKENFIINFNFQEEKFIIKLKKNITNEIFKSEYDLEFLKLKLKKFSEVSQIKKCLEDNISKEKLIINDFFDDAIYTTWELSPEVASNKNEGKEQNLFTLIIEKEISKNLSLIFNCKYEDSKFIIEEINKKLKLSEIERNSNKNYLELKYDNIIDNMIFQIMKTIIIFKLSKIIL